MKNLVKLASEREIIDYTEGLWKTEDFKKQHRDKDSYVGGVMNDFSKMPRVFYEMDDVKNERSHFTAWMNAIAHLEYSNPAISDLYYFHEYVHVATLSWYSRRSFDYFIKAIWENEMMASLNSEVLVYFEMPEFRSKTFGFEIWADRYLSDRERLDEGVGNVEFFKNDKVNFLKAMTRERIRAMKTPKSNDKNEELIHSYANLNNHWAEIWANNWKSVEQRMETFVVEAQADKGDAVNKHADWLLSQRSAGTNIPFEFEAREFSARIA